MLNRTNPVPLYYQLKENIKQKIENNEIKQGDKLPSEAEMIKEYGVGRLTIREALSQLVNEGYLEKRQGSGTFCKACSVKNPVRTIDVLLNASDSYFIPHYISGINGVLSRNNCSFIIHDTRHDADEIIKILEKILINGSSGIIIQASEKEYKTPEKIITLFQRFKQAGIPYIMIDSLYNGVDSSYVILDEVRGGYIAAEHLIKKGHVKVGGIFWKTNHESRSRKKGFLMALKDYNVDINKEWILYDDQLEEKLDYILKQDIKPSAFVCYNDEVALKCLRAIRTIGRRVPDDVAIVGYDDTFVAQNADIPLTTVVHPKEKLAELAAEKLIQIIDGNTPWPFRYTFEPEFIIREST